VTFCIYSYYSHLSSTDSICSVKLHWRDNILLYKITYQDIGFSGTWCMQCSEFESRSWRGILDTTLCNKVCQWLVTDRRFSPVSFNNKTDLHDITEILLKVMLNTISIAHQQDQLLYLNSYNPVSIYAIYIIFQCYTKCAWFHKIIFHNINIFNFM
jgi:hypothetical protein